MKTYADGLQYALNVLQVWIKLSDAPGGAMIKTAFEGAGRAITEEKMRADREPQLPFAVQLTDAQLERVLAGRSAPETAASASAPDPLGSVGHGS